LKAIPGFVDHRLRQRDLAAVRDAHHAARFDGLPK
jgi:hypothetical protein